jgi:hypothetical protein
MSEKHPKRPRDPNQLAKSIIDIATGETDERVPSFRKAKSGVSSRNINSWFASTQSARDTRSAFFGAAEKWTASMASSARRRL